MNRRDLIKKIAFGAPMLALAIPGPMPTIDHRPDQFVFHDWNIEWTGWKSLPNTDVQVCQWIAYASPTRGHWHLYSSWPGECGPFAPNSVFNIGLREDQMLTTRRSSAEMLDWCKSECLERLKRLIVKVGPPPFKSGWDELDPVFNTWTKDKEDNFWRFEKKLGFLSGSKAGI
ncbi:MAG TPA: hypothetical protein VJX30_03080 [Terriglobales bacterium]|jgi:hypothetical protein|nr:hypothetical protein [Terriglobales bacterium]